MMSGRAIRRPSAFPALALAMALAALPSAAALARTPTPSVTPTITDGPSPTVTATASPTPTGTRPPAFVNVRIDPNPARSGQRVNLSATNTDPFPQSYHWSYVGEGDGPLIVDADRQLAHFIAPVVSSTTVVPLRLDVTGYNTGPFFLSVTVYPADTVLVTVSTHDGAPGTTVPVEVTLHTLGLAVTQLEHEIAFDAYTPVADAGGGVPDCEAGPDIAALSARFAFVPAGCAASGGCSGVRATLAASAPISDGAVAYRCQLALSEEAAPEGSDCYHQIQCLAGTGTRPSGEGLQALCGDSFADHLSINYRLRPLAFDFRAEPAEPNVGDNVAVTVSVRGEGGLPQYTLLGAEPILHGELSHTTGGPLGDVSFALQADCPGTAWLELSVNYETLAGCPGNTHFEFTAQRSPAFALRVREPGSFRVAGRVADQPSGCAGGARVQVRIDPLGWLVASDGSGAFVFDGVPPGEYTLSVPANCGRFQCWLPAPIRVDAQDVDATLCPQRLAGDACIGDCNLDGTVMIDELVAGAGMLLGEQAFETCPPVDVDGDGSIRVHELIRAVGSALAGCH